MLAGGGNDEIEGFMRDNYVTGQALIVDGGGVLV